MKNIFLIALLFCIFIFNVSAYDCQLGKNNLRGTVIEYENIYWNETDSLYIIKENIGEITLLYDFSGLESSNTREVFNLMRFRVEKLIETQQSLQEKVEDLRNEICAVSEDKSVNKIVQISKQEEGLELEIQMAYKYFAENFTSEVNSTRGRLKIEESQIVGGRVEVMKSNFQQLITESGSSKSIEEKEIENIWWNIKDSERKNEELGDSLDELDRKINETTPEDSNDRSQDDSSDIPHYELSKELKEKELDNIKNSIVDSRKKHEELGKSLKDIEFKIIDKQRHPDEIMKEGVEYGKELKDQEIENIKNSVEDSKEKHEEFGQSLKDQEIENIKNSIEDSREKHEEFGQSLKDKEIENIKNSIVDSREKHEELGKYLKETELENIKNSIVDSRKKHEELGRYLKDIEFKIIDKQRHPDEIMKEGIEYGKELKDQEIENIKNSIVDSRKKHEEIAKDLKEMEKAFLKDSWEGPQDFGADLKEKEIDLIDNSKETHEGIAKDLKEKEKELFGVEDNKIVNNLEKYLIEKPKEYLIDKPWNATKKFFKKLF